MPNLTSVRVLSGAGGDCLLPRVFRRPILSYQELGSASWAEHRAWREMTVARLRTEGFGTTQGCRLGEVVDELAAELLRLCGVLNENYATPDLGNKTDAVDELVYIILSRRTRERAYQEAYRRLTLRYTSWEELASAPTEEIVGVVRPSGLAGRKAHSLKFALNALRERFGRCTLEPTQAWTDEEVMAFLCTLPEVGPKSAACVMVCSLDRPAFAVDAHVGRVLGRMQIFHVIGIDLGGTDHKKKQRLLRDAVPPALRYIFHVNLLVHGRVTCVPRNPRCGSCAIANACASRVSLGASSRDAQ